MESLRNELLHYQGQLAEVELDKCQLELKMDSKLAEMDQLDEINANLKQNLTSSKFMIQKLNEERESAESELRFKLWVERAFDLTFEQGSVGRYLPGRPSRRRHPVFENCLNLNYVPFCDNQF